MIGKSNMTRLELIIACKNRAAQMAMQAGNLKSVLTCNSPAHFQASIAMNKAYDEYHRLSKLIKKETGR